MKNYSIYQTVDFIQDPYFREWALGTLPPNDRFWEIWSEANPSKRGMLDEARMMVIALQIKEMDLSEEEIQSGIQHIMEATTSKRVLPLHRRPWVQIAAVLVLVFGAVWWMLGREPQSLNSPEAVHQTENESLHSMTIQLTDGSKVIVEPGSRLRVDKNFNKTNRTVYLTGEAYFDVKRNPEKPFLVITGHLVTKVLGTSFRVKAHHNDTDIQVSVRTGKVTVYRERVGSKNDVFSEQMILTPNQQAVFIKAEEKLVKTLVEQPMLLAALSPAKEQSVFEFEETPIPQVLGVLEKAYGIKMVFDAELLENCNLTASLGSEPLFEKLDLICETIQARYQIADGQVVVYAKGCK